MIVGSFSHADQPESAADAARRRHPGWDIIEDFAGWVAVPAGTPILQAMFLDSLEEKIAEAERGGDVA
jgi:hypothetical protein